MGHFLLVKMKLRNMLIENSISLPERRSFDLFPDLLGAASRRRDDNWNSSCKTDVQCDVDKTSNFHFWNDDIFVRVLVSDLTCHKTQLCMKASDRRETDFTACFQTSEICSETFHAGAVAAARVGWVGCNRNSILEPSDRDFRLSDWHMIQRILQASLFCNGTRCWREVLYPLLWLQKRFSRLDVL